MAMAGTVLIDPPSTLGHSGTGSGAGESAPAGNGAPLANIALLGNYMASSFAVGAGHHGASLISEATLSANQQPLLTQPRA